MFWAQAPGKVWGARMTLCIDDVFQLKLTKGLFAHEDGPEDLMIIGDEMTDEGGIKTFIAKFRGFEGMNLLEMLYVVVESTGTSEDLQQKFMKEILKTITTHTGYSEEETGQKLKEKLKGSGSDRAKKMPKFF